MTFALELRWRSIAIVCIEVVNIGGIVSVSSSKEMTTITELDFSASFDWDTFELLKGFR